MSNWEEQLDLLIRARTPIIWIRSNEEERVETLLKNSTKRLSPRRLATWDYIDGISNILNSNNLGSRQPMAVLEWLKTKASVFTPATKFSGVARNPP